MKIKNLITIAYVFLICHEVEAMIAPKTPLSSYSYSGASVLPITTWDGKTYWALFSQEAHGTDKDSWDDFGGKRDQGEKHPLVTAAREAWEESVNLLTDPKKQFTEKSLRDYIDLKAGNTQDIVISVDKAMVTYITNFSSDALEHVTKNFHRALGQATSRHLKEKKALAWVKYDDLKNVIANAPRNKKGALITPITIVGNIVNPDDPTRKGQLKDEQITLRPVFVSKLQDYFKGSPYVEGNDPKIKFFKRDYQPTGPTIPSIPIKPVIPTKPHVHTGPTLADYPYQQASVLPFTSWPQTYQDYYFLLSQSAYDTYPDTWSDFSGTKLNNEKNAIQTVKRVALNQSFNLLNIPTSASTIEHILNKSENIIVSENQQIVSYITQFPTLFLENVANNFYSNLLTKKNPEKKAIAWVRKADLEKAIKDSGLNAKGELITPINVRALVIKPGTVISRAEPSGTYSLITLNPLFVSKLVQFFKGLPYTPGESSNIKFFSGVKIQPSIQIISPKPKSSDINSLKLLSLSLSRLSLTRK